MKKYIVLVLSALVYTIVFAQTDAQIGQYMYMQTAYNPAAAGEGDLMKVAGAHRMQFVGITNAPMTTWFSFSSPFVIGKTRHGAGIRFLNDQYGLFTNQALHVQYAYRQKVGKGYLSLGADLGFINVGFKGDSVNLSGLGESEYHDPNDTKLPKGDKSGMKFDLGVGVYYATNTWWVSGSYSHLTNPVVELDELTEMRMIGTLYLAGGYSYRLKNHREWKLQPSVMAMTDFHSWDVNLTMMCELKERYRWGLGYRIAGSVNVLLGIDIVSGLQLGYTCELPTNKLILESYGSHELYLAYAFDILKPKRNSKYKSVRFL